MQEAEEDISDPIKSLFELSGGGIQSAALHHHVESLG